jgi:hypothetical protein
MHANVRSLNKKQLPICKNCVLKAIKNSKENTFDIDDEICTSINTTQTLEHDTIERLHKLNNIIEESNSIVN